MTQPLGSKDPEHRHPLHHHKHHHHPVHPHHPVHHAHAPHPHPAAASTPGATGTTPLASDQKALNSSGTTSTIGLPAANTPTGNSAATTGAQPLQGNFLATAYYPANNKMEGGMITSTGHPIHTLDMAMKDGKPCTVAVDPKVIPMGTKFTLKAFPGVTFQADDVGGAIKGHHIDIAMGNAHEANAWGRREVSG